MPATLSKADILKAVEELPDEGITLEDIIECLIVLSKVRAGLEQVTDEKAWTVLLHATDCVSLLCFIAVPHFVAKIRSAKKEGRPYGKRNDCRRSRVV